MMRLPGRVVGLLLTIVPAAVVTLPAEHLHQLVAGDMTAEIAVDTDRMFGQYGPRFDRTAIVVNITRSGRAYLDPRGLADEFGLNGRGVLGYDEAPVGGEFIKIGVGVLRRDTAETYKFSRAWPVARLFPVEVETTADSLRVSQASDEVAGHAYRYEKRYRLQEGGVLVIQYRLTNSGRQSFGFETYNHNFFSFASAVADAGYAVTPGFEIAAVDNPLWSYADGSLRLRQPAPARPGVYFGQELDVPAEWNRVVLRHTNGQQVEVTGDFPVVRFAVWATLPTICPEIFHRTVVPPGASVSWERRYRFGHVAP